MTMRTIFALAAAAALAACDNSAPMDSPDGPIQGQPADDSDANSVTTSESGNLPEPGPVPRFVGRWAADAESCETIAWRFSETMLNTPAGSSCSFNRVTEVPGGYDVQATCTAEGPPTSDTLEIRFAESAQAMQFESETIADAGLVYCGRET